MAKVFVFAVADSASGQESGRKRAHHKSRLGCIECKRRRVKCDDGRPACLNCVRRGDTCLRSKQAARATGLHSAAESAMAPCPSTATVRPPDNASTSLFHPELFHHFQTHVAHTLAFQGIWPQIIQWSLHEDYLMSIVLCLAATHRSTTATSPARTRTSHVALQLLVRSAALMSDKLAQPVEHCSLEKLTGASILMQYIAWSHTEFLDCQNMSQDPLLNLSLGVTDLVFRSLRALWGRRSAFLSTCLYSSRPPLEAFLREQGLDPGAYVARFMGIWDDTRFQTTSHQPPGQGDKQQPSPPPSVNQFEVFIRSGKAGCSHPLQERLLSAVSVFKMTSWGTMERDPFPSSSHQKQHNMSRTVSDIALPRPSRLSSSAQRLAFQLVSRGISIAICLASLPLSTLSELQPDIEHYLFALPILCAGTLRDLVSQGDARASVVLLHFYRAAQILLAGSRSWWAWERSREMETFIWQDLKARGLETLACV